MNGELYSEVKLTALARCNPTGLYCPKTQRNFSDLVPSFVTVECVSDTGYYSLKTINPMTASYYIYNAVMHPLAEIFLKKTRLNTLGAGLSCTPTVTFLKNIWSRLMK